jgi:hypothetical protein
MVVERCRILTQRHGGLPRDQETAAFPPPQAPPHDKLHPQMMIAMRFVAPPDGTVERFIRSRQRRLLSP